MVDLTPNWIKEIADDKERAEKLQELCISHYEQFEENKKRYDKLYEAYMAMVEKCFKLEGLK